MKPACEYPHQFLSLGLCPRCQQPIMDGQLKPDLPGRITAVRQWNMPAIRKALEDEDEEVRVQVMFWVLSSSRGPETDGVLPLLSLALRDSSHRVCRNAVRALYKRGRKLDREQAEHYEQESQRQGEDYALHLLLLGYYFLPATMFKEARRARQKHIFWVIEHADEIAAEKDAELSFYRPEEPEAYERAKYLWLKQIAANGDNLILLGDAAHFFCNDDEEISETLLKKAQSLEPHNPEWHKRLGHLYGLGLRWLTGASRRAAAARSFAEYEKAIACKSEESGRYWILPRIANAAFEAGELEKARAFATDLLLLAEQPGDFYQDGPAIFNGNLILGRLALKSGNIAEAKRRLVESAKWPDPPSGRYYQPNLTLAKEVLERDERDSVVEFLHLCTSFWQTDDHRTEKWIYEIRNGKTPDFIDYCF